MPGGRRPAAPAWASASVLPMLTAETLSARLRVPYCTVSRQVNAPLVDAPMDPSDNKRAMPAQSAIHPPTSTAVPAPFDGGNRFTRPFDTASVAPLIDW
ncbi:hypothetical protein G6F55_013780 [Rhizopus delemar]|nr:hypothetical protein G6F55_013780 [Rhizopus delemar]